jgi:hypothetical protein
MAARTGEVLMGLSTAVLATLLYAMRRDTTDAWASSALGHGLGIAGMLLMLWAGVGYTQRKHQAQSSGMAMSTAMLLHMGAGLLGPYLVLLHSGFAFRGLAGALTLVMVLVVASGVVGRAVMTAIPREVTAADPVRMAMLDADLARLETAIADAARTAPDDAASREPWRRELLATRHAQELLQQQVQQPRATAAWRRLLSGWWALHVPMSAALWVLAGAHVVGALYYATFSR